MEPPFSVPEKTEMLLKKHFGKPTTSLNRRFYEEPSRDASKEVIAQRQLWSSTIPDIAPPELINLSDSDLDDNGYRLAGSVVGKTSNSGLIKRFIKVPFSMITGSNGESYETTFYTQSHPNNNAGVRYTGAPASGFGASVSINYPSSDVIPFNFDDSPTGSYLYKLYRNNGTEINSGHGEWVVDVPTGTIMFHDYSSVSSEVSFNQPPLLSFYKYIGNKGLDAFAQSIAVGTTIFDSGVNGSIGDNLAALQVSTQPLTNITSGLFTDAIQFGTNAIGAFRICVEGGAASSLVVQKRMVSGWQTVHRLAQ